VFIRVHLWLKTNFLDCFASLAMTGEKNFVIFVSFVALWLCDLIDGAKSTRPDPRLRGDDEREQ
jgi:hypothetical protein